MKRLAILAVCCAMAAALAATMLPLKEHLRAALFPSTALPLPTGPHPVGTVQLNLPVDPQGNSPTTFPVRLWYPANVDAANRPRRDWLHGPTEAPAFRNAAALTGRMLPVILYAPSWNARLDDNTFRAANLASHGYLVAAFDDVVHDPPGLTGAEGPDRAATLDFSTAERYGATRPLADARAVREARKAILVLDRLAADSLWRRIIDLTKVGMLGFSFGGAAAAEAPALDPRVKAVVNLDGWVFREAAPVGVAGPYLTLWSDFPVPFALADAPQAEIELMNAYIAFERRQMGEPDKFGFMVQGLNHLDFSDRLIWPAFSEFRGTPRAIDRPAMHGLIDAYILDFFDTYLLGHQPTLINRPQPPYPQVRSISSISASQAATASAPAKPD
jgi:dienelactone hydrolase